LLPLIAIDGPAGVGKSTTSRAVAARLGVPYLDTGALYRAIAWTANQRGIDPRNHAGMARLTENIKLNFTEGETGTRVWVDGKEVTGELRTPTVTKTVTPICEIHSVRERLVELQRRWASRGFGIMEGRDIGTVVLPRAPLKIFLTAKPEVRAVRRSLDLGIVDDKEALSRLAGELAERDRRDSQRSNSPLRQASDAVVIDNTDLSFNQQVNRILSLAVERFSLKLYGVNS